MTRLSNATLALLKGKANLPRYDRGSLKTGIVHLGVGAFHRAHQACYTEAALNAGDLQWGSIGASLRSPDTRDALTAQNGLYTIAVRGAEGEKFEINGGMRKIVVAPDNPEALIAAMARPDIKIVSLTVTEKGLLPRSGIRQSQRLSPRYPARSGTPECARLGPRLHPAGDRPPTASGPAAVHAAQLRQPPGERAYAEARADADGWSQSA